MAKATDLMNRYLEALEAASADENQDSTSVLLKTDWVRIVFVPAGSENMIEVEMSTPGVDCSSSSTAKDQPEETGLGNCPVTFLHSMIDHLHYLAELQDSGFSVDFAGNGCLFVAFCRFAGTPDWNTFRLLLPPSAGSKKGQKGPTSSMMSFII
ncbi:hypothetical protein EU545_02210 [Candidatus Thorarchaeota archaeon]|nr:MAG: hypothetical protein EU545_02210 [Candidatus Thorarchaeota archaeon]